MKPILSIVLAFFITGGAVVARASDSESERQTLSGLQGVAVLVDRLQSEVELAGLTRASILTDVELKLRLAGIPVLEGVDVANMDSPYYLYVRVGIQPISDGFWPYFIDVAFDQEVLLGRDRSIVSIASTWSVEYIGRVLKPNVQKVREDLENAVDKFINAYLSVNPK